MRKSGVLMHLSSLASPYGVGTMGKEAREFADFLAAAGQSCWQLLPICPTSFGDSPYQSFSTFAGNPYFIDLDTLAEEGLLEPEEYRDIDWQGEPEQVNYGALYEKRYPVLRLAAARLLADPPAEYGAFCEENAWWLSDYALFMALKDAHGGCPYWEWEEALRARDAGALREARERYAGETAAWQALQFLFFKQWRALKKYANDLGIEIIGDLPIYVSRDSVDVWTSPALFQLDRDGTPTEVSGCPPDPFSPGGQLWGNPIYDWDHMAGDGYAWWMRRIDYLCGVYDILRIDHFRGFDEYYAVPFGAPDARGGRWRKGPGIGFFRAMWEELGPRPIIAEDLGFLTDSVRELLRESGCPGMKILQFGFDGRDGNSSEYIPHNFPVHCVAYTGTHDNDTVMGWLATAPAENVAQAKAYLHLTEEEGPHWGMMRGLWSSVAELAIVQAQDLLGLGVDARMNRPSTLGGNWQWRARPGVFDKALAQKLRRQTALYGRLNGK